MTNEVTRTLQGETVKFKSDRFPGDDCAVVEAGLYAANGMKQSPIINEKSPMRNSLWLLQHYWHCHSRTVKSVISTSIILHHYLSLNPML